MKDNPSFLPIHLTGGIGDVIMSIDQLDFISNKYSTLLYTTHTEAAKYFRASLPLIHGYPNHSWHLEFNTVARFRLSEDFSGFLMREHENLYNSHQNLLKNDDVLKELVDNHPHKDYELCKYAHSKGIHRRNFPLFCLGFPSLQCFTENRITPDKYITIHDGYDTAARMLVYGRATKTWDLDHWARLVENIKSKYPEYRILQLGSQTARPIPGAESLINKTGITQAFDILRKSSLHIDGDSGLVHGATRMSVPCIVVWGPTPPSFYGYPQNVNIRSNICEDACFWKTKDWMDKCPLNYSTPKCMDATSVDEVFQNVTKILKV